MNKLRDSLVVLASHRLITDAYVTVGCGGYWQTPRHAIPGPATLDNAITPPRSPWGRIFVDQEGESNANMIGLSRNFFSLPIVRKANIYHMTNPSLKNLQFFF